MAARISEDITRIIEAARRDAERSGLRHAGPGHVLVALAADQRLACARILADSGVGLTRARTALRQRRPAGTDPAGIDRLIDRAAQRAEELGRREARPEDLLLALTDRANDATEIIAAAGGRVDEIRDRALRAMRIPRPGTPDPAARPGTAPPPAWAGPSPTADPDLATRPAAVLRPELAPRPVVVPPAGRPGVTAAHEPGGEASGADEERSRRVFVIHGRDREALAAVRDWLRAVGLKPVDYHEVETLSDSVAPMIPETVANIFTYAQAIVALLTPDETVTLRPHLREHGDDPDPDGQSRPNVQFETGMAFGVRPNDTVIVQIGDVRPFSDVAGRSVLRLNGDTQVLHTLRDKLRQAGCRVREQGSDWLDGTRFARLDEARRRHPPT